MNKVPTESLEKYTDSFKMLLNLFNSNNPINLNFKFQRVRDLYSSETEFWNELNSYFAETKDNWKNFDENKKASRKKMILLNYMFYKDTKNEDLEGFLTENTQLHDAYLRMTKRKDFIRGPDKVVIFSFPIPDSITLGATKYSAAKFWTGYGALKMNAEGNYEDIVLTPEQLKDQAYKIENVDFIDLKNFKNIRVYK